MGNGKTQGTDQRKLQPSALTSSAQERGRLGEALVSQWLQQQGWHILAERWHCPWGEIDVIAQGESVSGESGQGLAHSSTLLKTIAFVEVKTRSPKNIDAGGVQAITARKRQKLWQTAELFLAEFPQFADWNCRFDVALVTCEPLKVKPIQGDQAQPLPKIERGTALCWQGHRLNLHQYLTNIL
ncbi:MAG: YraN family protein [Prochlorotrichaceae cyanobacterium]|jgi:putative endonuclease